jgi:hypothetical protein
MSESANKPVGEQPVEDRDPGDLGRRLAERRDELRLTRDDIARIAGMGPGYIEYL